MKKNFFTFLLGLTISIPALAIPNYQTEFKNVYGENCNKTFQELEKNCMNMICQDQLVQAQAICWENTMKQSLDEYLSTLKKENSLDFHQAVFLQKTFMQDTENLCGKNCSNGGTMKGIPYNFCRIDAYQYRTAQIIATSKNILEIDLPAYKLLRSEEFHPEHPVSKNTAYYEDFSKKLCEIPKKNWKNKIVPENCETQTMATLNKFSFTNDVCNLS